MVDVFEEVEEQLRSDRYKRLGLKVLPWVIGIAVLAILIAVGVWIYSDQRDKQAFEASEKYAAALQSDNADKAFAAFGALTTDAPPAYKAMALMQQGAIRLEQGRTADAVKLLDQSAEAAPDPLLGDLARLKSAFALLDTAQFKDIESRLTPLTENERPYRVQAKEALAFARLLAGQTQAARGDFAVLALSPESSEEVRQRAQAAMQMIDSGSAAALPAAVKAAAASAKAAPQPIPAQPGAAQ